MQNKNKHRWLWQSCRAHVINFFPWKPEYQPGDPGNQFGLALKVKVNYSTHECAANNINAARVEGRAVS